MNDNTFSAPAWAARVTNLLARRLAMRFKFGTLTALFVSKDGDELVTIHGTLAGQCGANNQKFREQMEAVTNRLTRMDIVFLFS